MKEEFTVSKVLRLILSIYLAGSLFYATIHLLGFGWFQSSNNSLIQPDAIRQDSVSVHHLQKKYHTLQSVTWTNAEGSR